MDLPKENWGKLVEILEESETDLPLEQFLHHYWLSKYDYTTVKKLFKEIKKEITKSNAKEFLDSLVREAAFYRILHEPSFNRWKKDEKKFIPRSLEALNLFRVKQQIPMVLSIVREYNGGGIKLKHAEDALRAIENFHFIYTAITSQRSSGGISFMYALHARQLLGAENLQDKVKVLTELKRKLSPKLPSLPEFEANFTKLSYSDEFTKQKKIVQYILAKFCEHYSQGGVVDYEQMTIEHLAPQSPKSGEQVSPEKMASIGNLVLVDSKLNDKLANKSFKEKKLLLQKSNVPLDETILKATEWTEKEIDARTSALCALAFKKLWRI